MSNAFLDGRPTGLVGTLSMPFRVARRLLNTGLGATWQRMRTKASIAYHEWRHGLRTESFVPWNEISDDSCTVDYEPTTYTAIEHVLSHVSVQPQDTLLDYGCGLGRVLAMAIKNGFPRVIGVELSSQLCSDARTNLARCLGSDAERAEIVCENAAEWQTPDEATVIYLFNPFRGQVLEQTLDRIRESLLRRPRPVKILYLQPLVDENRLARRSWLRLDHEETLEGIRFCVFTHQP